MFANIKSGLQSSEGNAVLTAGLLGLLLSDLIPTPADAWYFSIEKKLRDRWDNKQISPKEYWLKSTMAYYGVNTLWWLTVMVVTLSVPGSATSKLKIGLGFIGAGVVGVVIFKNVGKDEKMLAAQGIQIKDKQPVKIAGK